MQMTVTEASPEGNTTNQNALFLLLSALPDPYILTSLPSQLHLFLIATVSWGNIFPWSSYSFDGLFILSYQWLMSK